jgi:hypothetical protein
MHRLVLIVCMLTLDISLVAGDDYGVSKLQVVYYDQNKPLLLQRANLGIKASFDQFVFFSCSA